MTSGRIFSAKKLSGSLTLNYLVALGVVGVEAVLGTAIWIGINTDFRVFADMMSAGASKRSSKRLSPFGCSRRPTSGLRQNIETAVSVEALTAVVMQRHHVNNVIRESSGQSWEALDSLMANTCRLLLDRAGGTIV